MNKKNLFWEKQINALRDPVEITTGRYEVNGIDNKILKYKVSGNFERLLKKLKITLLISREYEHLVIALNNEKKFRQSFFHLPHPSGIAVDRDKNLVYIASTRNPNVIWEFAPTKNLKKRIDSKLRSEFKNYLMPIRNKFFAGHYYFHDLAIISGKLYANSVGQNAIVNINMNSTVHDKIVWKPHFISEEDISANYIQLNSIAPGKTLKNSFFTASGEKTLKLRPGHINYPVDKRGILISAKNKIVARGLTRPHSARIYKNKVWIANSGYGEVGYVNKNSFKSIIKLPGWTRGLCLVNNIMFVGVSRVIPKFRKYAPGLDLKFNSCGVYAIDLTTKKIVGSIIWPSGSQIFSIDYIENKVSSGFIFEKANKSSDLQKDFYYKYEV